MLGLAVCGICPGQDSPTAAADPEKLITTNANSTMIENDLISVLIEKAGRKLVSVTVQDKVNGRTYNLGNGIFCMEVLDEDGKNSSQ